MIKLATEDRKKSLPWVVKNCLLCHVKKCLPCNVKRCLLYHVKNSLPCGCKITLPRTVVNKLQGESYSGVSVTPEGSRVGVSINLEDAFLDYQTGDQFTAVMNRLADTIVGTLGERDQFDLGFLEDYRAVKDMLTVEVVGKDQNAEILQSVPHQELEDLAAVYRIALGETENGNATVLITNEMMRNYGITPGQLHQDALDAAQHTMKYSISDIWMRTV